MVPDAGVIAPRRPSDLRRLPFASLVSPFRPVERADKPGNTVYVTAGPDYAAAARHADMQAALIPGWQVPRGELVVGFLVLGLCRLSARLAPRLAWAIG